MVNAGARIETVEVLEEARRVATVCNACRYCEGFCPVFPEMSRHRSFDDATLIHLANLCHNCTACYHACQYKPPHALDVNVPVALSDLREASYSTYAWPSFMARAFRRRAGTLSLGIVIAITLTAWAARQSGQHTDLDAVHTGAGAFYAVIPHWAIVAVAGATLGFAVLSIVMSAARYLQATRASRSTLADHLSAARHALAARHLDGGQGQGCNTRDDRFSNARRYLHQAAMGGFLLCFAATCVATFYELVLGIMSPFALTSLPVVLGSIGGAALIVGTLGLVWLRRSIPEAVRARDGGASSVLSIGLALIAATGFALLALRETRWMGTLLVIHLALVLAFFVLLPYGKMVHGLYRYLALVRDAARRLI